MKPIQYRFSINGRYVTPQYNDDLTKDYEMESSQQFFREKLNGKISLIKEDYQWIYSQDFETEFILLIEESRDGGKTWNKFLNASFCKTDCKWDEDNQKCEISTNVYDQYTDVMAGLEKEYNLIKLKPEINRISIIKRPLIQVYIPGGNVVSCFLGGTYWEQEVTEAVSDPTELEQTYYFTPASPITEINIQDGIYAGVYSGKTQLSGNNQAYIIEYYQRYYQDITESPEGQIVNECYENGYKIKQLSTGKYVSIFSQTKVYRDSIPQDPWGEIPENLTFSGQEGNEGAKGEYKSYNVHMRWLLDREYALGKQTYTIPTNDILSDNRSYKRCLGYGLDVLATSVNYSEEPTEWGLAPNNLYYDKPAPGAYYPIARSSWRYSSLWFKYDLLDPLIEEKGRSYFYIRDCYPLHSVIQVLLKQFSDITHENKPEYSQFLYSGRNPLTNQDFELYITPKSNVLHGNYDQPAQQAKTTLKAILEALRDMYRCYWYIEDGKLKIEHISFFRNGGIYNQAPGVGVDLTKLQCVKNGHKWGYLTSNYEYEKSDMPERYQFGWMDDVTEAFEGYPIEIKSKYVTAGNIEEVSIQNFTTDIDYMILNPSAISQDGFAMFAATKEDIWVNRPIFYVYNGYLNNKGEQVYNQDGDGKGWKYTIFDKVVPGTTYNVIIRDLAGGNYLWNFFDSNGTHIAQSASNTPKITIPDNCYELGMSWRAQTDASPTNLPVVDTNTITAVMAQDLSLPVVQLNVDNTQLRLQNGWQSFISLVPSYYIYDLPAKSVKINNSLMTLSDTARNKKQKVKFPDIGTLDVKKLVKTYIGNGQISKISINLSSRINEVELMYDTE